MTLTAVTTGDFSEANTKLTVANPDDVEDLWLEHGDILIERSNTPELVGTAKMYRGPKRFAIFPDLLVRARIVPTLCASYIEMVLESDFSRRFFRRRAKGLAGSMPKIDQGTILRLPVPVPPCEEQERIVSQVEALLSVCTNAARQIGMNLLRATSLRQSILKQALEGKLVEQDPADEPAGVLLERIKVQVPGPGKKASRAAQRSATDQAAP